MTALRFVLALSPALRAAAVVIAIPCVAGAGLVATHDEVLISPDTAATQRHPAVAVGAEHGRTFVVVWDQESPDVDGIHLFSAPTDGTANTPMSFSTPSQIDTAGIVRNESPDVTAIAGGEDAEFVAVWRSDPMNGARPVISAVRLGEHGGPSGTEFVVNTARDVQGEYYLSAPRVAGGFDGSFVVVWASGAQDDSDYGYGPRTDVFARTFTSDGDAVTGDVALSTPGGVGLDETEFRPDAAATSAGEFVVVWARGEIQLFGSQFTSRALRLDSLGQPIGSEIAVGLAGIAGPRISPGRPEGFQVAWSSHEYIDIVPGAGAEVLGRAFDESGAPLAEPFVASSPATGLNPSGDPRVPFAGVGGTVPASGAAGEFVIAWTSGTSAFPENYGGSSDGDGSGIFVRTFTADGETFGAERRANETTAGEQTAPDVAMSRGKAALVVWQGDHIYGRRFEIAAPRCADVDESGAVVAGDALAVLQAAVGARACDVCLCDADGSGSSTAADALIVLRTSVGLDTTLVCSACADPFAVEFALQTDAPCYGVRAAIPRGVLPEDGEDLVCAPAPALSAAGCDVRIDGGGLGFDVRGCFLDSQPLFSCHATPSQAEAMALAAEMRCGCGCAETCPTAPVLCASLANADTCSPEVTLAPVAPRTRTAAVFSTTTAGQILTSSTAPCATCCDVLIQADVSLEDPVTLSELAMRFEATPGAECTDEIVDCQELVDTGGPSYTRTTGNQVEVCLTAPEPIYGPTLLGFCYFLSGNFASGPVEVLRALDYDFRPLDPAPAILLDDHTP